MTRVQEMGGAYLWRAPLRTVSLPPSVRAHWRGVNCTFVSVCLYAGCLSIAVWRSGAGRDTGRSGLVVRLGVAPWNASRRPSCRASRLRLLVPLRLIPSRAVAPLLAVRLLLALASLTHPRARAVLGALASRHRPRAVGGRVDHVVAKRADPRSEPMLTRGGPCCRREDPRRRPAPRAPYRS